MKVGDVEDACGRREARWLVEPGCVHLEPTCARVESQDPARRAVGDEDAVARVDDDCIGMPSGWRREPGAEERCTCEENGADSDRDHPRQLHRAMQPGSRGVARRVDRGIEAGTELTQSRHRAVRFRG